MELRDNYRKGNFIWCVRDKTDAYEIVEYYKTREKALEFIEEQYRRVGESINNPYECDNYFVDVVCMKD